MRTNIDLDDDLMDRALKYSVGRSKRAVVHEALEVYVTAKEAERRREDYARRLEALRAKTRGKRMSRSAASVVRKDRERHT